jgi:hypothetical protein
LIPFVDFGISNLVYFLCWTITERTYGQSIGKTIMRIRLTNLDGEHAGPARAAIERVGKACLHPSRPHTRLDPALGKKTENIQLPLRRNSNKNITLATPLQT